MSNRYISNKMRDFVFERAKGRCEYCQCWAKNALHTFNIEHIIPLIKGGKNDLMNLALACNGCNSAKRDKLIIVDVLTDEKIQLYNPRTEKWEDHFIWSDNLLEVVGKTAIGRVTITELKLNRTGVKNMRRFTKMVGEHPPTD